MVETDGKTYINVIDDGVTGAFCMQTLSMTEENVRVAIMSALTSAYLRRKAYLDFLKTKGRRDRDYHRSAQQQRQAIHEGER